MARPIKILFLLEDLCFGGTQKQTLALASMLDRQLFSPSILTLTGPTDLDEKAIKADIPLFHMGRGRKAAPFFFARLGSHIARLKPDILAPCTALPNIWGRIWGSLKKIPVIVGTCRGGGAPMRQHERFLWRLADHIICNSPALLGQMRKRGVPAEMLTFIPNGVDTDFFQPSPGGKMASQVILCAARLAKDKDHISLLNAFAIVAKEFPNAVLRLVGEGPEEDVLKSAASRLPAETARRVEFAGSSMDMRRHYAQADIFALASIREGQPNVILEAMSAGLPVCATNAGGIPSIVEHNRSGLLSGPRKPDALAANMAVFLRDAALAKSFGAAGRQIAENNFSFARMKRAHEELFMKLLEKCGAKKKGE